MKATAPRKAAPDTGQFDLEIALSKARAASILLAAIPEYLQIPAGDITDEQAEGVYGWIQNFAHDALDAALEEAEAARRKLIPRELDFAAGPGRKAAGVAGGQRLTLEEAAARLQLKPSTMKKWLRRQLEGLGTEDAS